jgi:hypothetical protein
MAKTMKEKLKCGRVYRMKIVFTTFFVTWPCLYLTKMLKKIMIDITT